ncbi:hypothetical protein RIF29_18287 [Crotalaria pallida]|uniref:Uncharacterized protein n=1 Tax=Crotalaria pallida TaxID=3830 RepID=A0AAN9FIL7_CROPI
MGASQSVSETSIHEFTVKWIYCEKYTQLTQLYSTYKEKGFEVLAFPCNQFLYQEPGLARKPKSLPAQDIRLNIPFLKRQNLLISAGYEVSMTLSSFLKHLISSSEEKISKLSY